MSASSFYPRVRAANVRRACSSVSAVHSGHLCADVDERAARLRIINIDSSPFPASPSARSVRRPSIAQRSARHSSARVLARAPHIPRLLTHSWRRAPTRISQSRLGRPSICAWTFQRPRRPALRCAPLVAQRAVAWPSSPTRTSSSTRYGFTTHLSPPTGGDKDKKDYFLKVRRA